jgi:hypothetical protein
MYTAPGARNSSESPVATTATKPLVFAERHRASAVISNIPNINVRSLDLTGQWVFNSLLKQAAHIVQMKGANLEIKSANTSRVCR